MPGAEPRELHFPSDHRLKIYSLTATAAGVSVLALAAPGNASVVVTHANISIYNGVTASIDLNKDGINDFRFSTTGGGYVPSFVNSLLVTPLTGGQVAGGNRGRAGAYASALASGAKIGSTAHFSSSVGRGNIAFERIFTDQTGNPSHIYYGRWHNVADAYLGVRFLIKGAIHYGWVRIQNGVTITEFAYETVANKSITAGATSDADDTADGKSAPGVTSPSVASRDRTSLNQPSPNHPSLGMLALGVEGLPIWRRSQRSQNRATREQ